MIRRGEDQFCWSVLPPFGGLLVIQYMYAVAAQASTLGVCQPHSAIRQSRKKMIILQKGNRRAQETPDISPRGEPGIPPGVLTPQSPCTVERAVGVGTLYQDTIYASAATTKGGTARCRRAGGVITPRRVGSASWVRGTSTLPSRGWGTVAITKV